MICQNEVRGLDIVLEDKGNGQKGVYDDEENKIMQ